MIFLVGLVLVPILAVVGGLFVYYGRRHREGLNPHCFKCDHDLSGGPLTECPRCHTYLPMNRIEYGERMPRRTWIVTGQIILGAVLITTIVLSVETFGRLRDEWYGLRPLSIVVSDLNDPPFAERAGRELRIRLRTGELSTADQQRIADQLLSQLEAGDEIATELRYVVLDTLGTFCEQDAVTTDQESRLFAWIDRVTCGVNVSPDGSEVILIDGIDPPDGWLPVRQIEVLSIDGKTHRIALFDGIDFAPRKKAVPPPRPIPLKATPQHELIVQMTTRWVSYKLDLVPNRLREITPKGWDPLMFELRDSIPVPMTAYAQRFTFRRPADAPTFTLTAQSPRAFRHPAGQ